MIPISIVAPVHPAIKTNRTLSSHPLCIASFPALSPTLGMVVFSWVVVSTNGTKKVLQEIGESTYLVSNLGFIE